VKDSVKTNTAYTEIQGMVRLQNKTRIKKWQRKSIKEGTRNGKEKQMKHRTKN